MSEYWQLKALGRPHLLTPAGEPLRTERKALALLTYLILEGPTPRSRLAGLLWPDTTETVARNNLVHLLRRMRRAHGTDLVRANGRQILEVDPQLRSDLDVEPAPPEEDSSRDAPLLEHLELDDCPDLTEWLEAQRERWRQRRIAGLTERAQALEDAGELRAALTLTGRLLELAPLSEEAYRRAMRLHYLLGDRAAAQAAFLQCQELLERELGYPPMPETVALARDISRGTLPDPPPVRRTAIPVSVLRPPTLIGRQEAWERMQRAWDQGQFIIITGEPGIGKTRLITDFARSKGAALFLEARPGDATIPYSTTARHVRGIFAHAPDLPERLPAWAQQALSELLPDVYPQHARARPPQGRLVQAVQLAFQLGLEGVAACVYDDIQYADSASIEVGFQLVSNAFPLGRPGGIVPWICCYRSGELSAYTADVYERLIEAGQATQIDLAPLGPADISQLITDLEVPELALQSAQLARFTGGNPLFVLETVKDVLESGANAPQLRATPRVSQLISRRLERLSLGALHAARAAAVLQSDFRLELVAEVLGMSLLEVAAAWEELEAAQVMVGERFSHDLVFETVRMGLPETERKLLNRSAARALARAGASPARIAQHWRAGGDLEQAAAWSLQAGTWAEAAQRAREAEEHYALAARDLEGGPSQLSYQEALTLLQGARAQGRQGT